MKRTLTTLSMFFLLLPVSLFGVAGVTAAEWNVGTGQNYTTIQSAINNANTHDGDVINVYNGTYTEDVLVNKRLTIQVKNGDNVEIKATHTGFTVIKDLNGDGSGTTIKGFKITNSPTGTGINITVANCTIENNDITGGKAGIVAILSEGYSTISGNKISNISGDDARCGIALTTIGNLTGFKVIRNTITNIRSDEDEASGIKAAGRTLNGKLEDLIVSGNVISNINGFVKATGMDILGLPLFRTGSSVIADENIISNVNAVNGSASGIQLSNILGNITNLKASKNTITNINAHGSNSNSIGLVVTGVTLGGKIDNTLVSGNKISQINGGGINSTSVGLTVFSMANGTVLVSENQVSKLIATKNTVGIQSVGLGSGNLKLEKNTVSDLTAAEITSGIDAVNIGFVFPQIPILQNLTNNQTVPGLTADDIDALINDMTAVIGSITSGGEVEILHNTVNKLKGNNTLAIVAGINNAIIKGNNLEGNGKGTGVLLVGPNEKTVEYNRIVNFQYYIQNFNYASLGIDIDKITKFVDDHINKITTEAEKHAPPKFKPYLKTIVQKIVLKMEELFKKMEESNTNAHYNWYGTNDPPSSKFFKGEGTLNYYPWLVLNITADPSTIYADQTSNITANVLKDAACGYHTKDAAMFFSGPQVTFTTKLGNVGSKSISASWVTGIAKAFLRSDEGPGITTINATDYESVKTTVIIL